MGGAPCGRCAPDPPGGACVGPAGDNTYSLALGRCGAEPFSAAAGRRRVPAVSCAPQRIGREARNAQRGG